jgi:hypothetical protein
MYAMTETVVHQGTCPKCGQTVDLFEYDELDDARDICEYFLCLEHVGTDGQCEGSGKMPISVPALETRWGDDDDFLTMGDINPEDLPPEDNEAWDGVGEDPNDDIGTGFWEQPCEYP